MLLYFAKQMPSHYVLEIDADAFMHCVTYIRGGTRVRLGPWINGPGWRPAGATRTDPAPFEPHPGELKSQDEVRASKWRAWERYYDKMSSHIPRAVTRTGVGDPRPYTGVDVSTVLSETGEEADDGNEASGVIPAGTEPDSDSGEEEDSSSGKRNTISVGKYEIT